MVSVDLNVKEGIPTTGVFTSDQGSILIGDLEVIRITSATCRYNNGSNVYFEASKIFGTTYAGLPRVSINISRAYINTGEMRLLMGAEPGIDIDGKAFYPGNQSLDQDTLNALLGLSINTKEFPLTSNSITKSSYPPKIDIQLIVGKNGMPSQAATNADPSGAIASRYRHLFTAYRVKLNSVGLMMDSRGLITSPFSAIGSEMVWEVEDLNASGGESESAEEG